MPFAAYRDDNTRMFHSDFITYGLRASGYLTHVNTWPRYLLRSAQLDPNNPANYNLTAAYDPIMGFTVQGTIAPVAFINGPGMYVGSHYENGATTFYYMMANEATRIWVFDTMRNFPTAGLKCFADDANNTLTFNSAMVPLNVVARVNYPAPVMSGVNGFYSQVFPGSSRRWVRYKNAGNSAVTLNSVAFQSLGAGNFACTSTFTRFFAQGKMDGNYPDGEGGSGTPKLAYVYSMSAIDGCYGASGGIYLSTNDAPRCPMVPNNNTGTNTWFSIPTNRYPSAIVINIDEYPFPYLTVV